MMKVEQSNKTESTSSGRLALLVMPDIDDSLVWKAVGVLVTIATLGVSIILSYGFFFERENYFNRLALYKWIKKNKLPEPYRLGQYKNWKINGLQLTLVKSGVWYLFDRNNLSKINHFEADIFDSYRYRQIKKILEV